MLRSIRKRPFLKWLPFWPGEKFRMSKWMQEIQRYPKIFLLECSISVPSVAQFYQKFAHICRASSYGLFICRHVDSHVMWIRHVESFFKIHRVLEIGSSYWCVCVLPWSALGLQ